MQKQTPVAVFEIGLNHLGDFSRAERLVETLAAQRATHATLQIIEDPRRHIRDAARAERLGRCALRPEQNIAVLQRAAALGMTPGAVIVDPGDIHRVLDAGARFFKVLSTDITFELLLRKLARARCPVYLSTGASTEQEIARAVGWMRDSSAGADVRLIHTVLCPPTPADQLNLLNIPALSTALGLSVAYGQHSDDPDALVAALAAGAESVFVYVMEAPDPALPDGPHAIRCSDAGALLKRLARVRAMRGTPHRMLPAEEQALRGSNRRSIVAARLLPKGKMIGEEDLAFKQPATGLPPSEFSRLLGRTADRDYAPDEDVLCGLPVEPRAEAL